MVALFEFSAFIPALLGENETADILGIDPKWLRGENEVVFYSSNDEWISITYRAAKISKELARRLEACETTDLCCKPTVYRVHTKDKVPVALLSRAKWPGAVNKELIL